MPAWCVTSQFHNWGHCNNLLCHSTSNKHVSHCITDWMEVEWQSAAMELHIAAAHDQWDDIYLENKVLPVGSWFIACWLFCAASPAACWVWWFWLLDCNYSHFRHCISLGTLNGNDHSCTTGCKETAYSIPRYGQNIGSKISCEALLGFIGSGSLQ
jgi:hypothetical protein